MHNRLVVPITSSFTGNSVMPACHTCDLVCVVLALSCRRFGLMIQIYRESNAK